ncbi:TIGR03619 family F420-dependent LLM class oxidoreductase [Streptomyces sp. NBC_00859]|uniref:TIGR03619 family F420-dependent LLM class oxidoreductase n=1 Tax=Streptomyces sp. NBC_00859 TaxID=2903682 RepID=UPI003864B265|nr:TIGR03619 family F420-dependent LLM class oxidoreductase [Streptomyces sp. NBC_00859]
MEFGVNILNFGPGTTPASLLQQALAARECGYSFAMISDHVAVTADVHEAYPAPFYDQFVLAAHLAGRVPGLTLGTTVTVVPYRHPLHTARLAANIDCLNPEGFILGAGTGWSRPEYAALGVPFAERGRIADEYLAAIRAAWAEDPTTFRGEYVSYENVHTAPAPRTEPGLPVWVGGNSPAALRRAARLGEGWHPYLATLPAMRAALPVLAEEADRAGRATPALVPRLQVRVTETRLRGEHPVGHGTVDQIREDLAALAALGATHLLLDTNPDLPGLRGTAADDRRLLELLAEEVLDPASGTIR